MQEIMDKALRGDIRAGARLIRDIDDGVLEVRTCSKQLWTHTGMIKNQLVQNVFEQIKNDSRFEAAVTAIVNQEMDPYAACDRGGCIHALDALNQFFLISQMIIPGPSY